MATNVAIAPRTGTTGTRTVGGHVQAWRNQPAFAPTAKLEFTGGANRWRAGTPGSKFYEAVMAHNPGTVQAALDLGNAAGIKAAECQGHLRWLYTWGVGLKVDGAVYVPPTAGPAPTTAPAKKAKGKAKVAA